MGFPGETDADFAATLRLVEEVGFVQAYSFKYSPRPGTPAADAAAGRGAGESGTSARLAGTAIDRQSRAFNERGLSAARSILFDRRGRKPGPARRSQSPYMQAVHADADGTARPIAGRA